LFIIYVYIFLMLLVWFLMRLHSLGKALMRPPQTTAFLPFPMRRKVGTRQGAAAKAA
jgi:hypothetical protein